MKIKNYRRPIPLLLCLTCFIALTLFGCVGINVPGGTTPSPGAHYGTAPKLSNVSVSPNPTYAGNIVNINATYLDPDADLNFGVAAISVDGAKLSRIAFRTTYPSGLLTIPIMINSYSRPSDVQISLAIRDSYGNWSNSVSTTLSIR